MGALDTIKNLEQSEALNKLSSLGLTEYGVYNEKLDERINLALEESKEDGCETGVLCGLNNADTEGILLSVLKENPDKVMEGIAAVAYAMGTDNKVLVIPEFASDVADLVKASADKFQVTVKTEFINVRGYKGYALIHIVTAANVTDALNGENTDFVYVSVNGGELKKAASDTKISDLADMNDAKAVLVGYRFETPDISEKTVGEANIANGVLTVLTSKDCVVQKTGGQLLKDRAQSCGKCVFCREGLIQLEYMQKEITEGRGKTEFIDLTREIGEAMCDSTLCSMGQVSAEIAITATEKYTSEYDEHIKKKNCPAGTCTSFTSIYIDPQLCTGCEECTDVCPVDCIEGKAKFIHMIDDFDCTKCGKCMEACDEDAIILTSGKVPKLPSKLTKVGKFKKH